MQEMKGGGRLEQPRSVWLAEPLDLRGAGGKRTPGCIARPIQTSVFDRLTRLEIRTTQPEIVKAALEPSAGSAEWLA